MPFSDTVRSTGEVIAYSCFIPTLKMIYQLHRESTSVLLVEPDLGTKNTTILGSKVGK